MDELILTEDIKRLVSEFLEKVFLEEEETEIDQ